jgi:hypothetical protein
MIRSSKSSLTGPGECRNKYPLFKVTNTEAENQTQYGWVKMSGATYNATDPTEMSVTFTWRSHGSWHPHEYGGLKASHIRCWMARQTPHITGFQPMEFPQYAWSRAVGPGWYGWGVWPGRSHPKKIQMCQIIFR